MKDVITRCVDCGVEFLFSAGEQRYFKKRKLYPPKRCVFCRKRRKELKDVSSEGAGFSQRNGQQKMAVRRPSRQNK